MAIRITGTGAYIPTERITNADFAKHEFLNEDGSPFPYTNDVVAQKFEDITGIQERRYASNHLLTSDIATLAARQAIAESGIDPETLDYVILAHNFGDVRADAIQTDILPSLASRVKHALGIKNPRCVAYDILFGCPGWIEGVIQAQAFIRAGMARRCLVIGAETLSRVLDPHDRDSMIYSDGAGAAVVEWTQGEGGILTHATLSYTADEAYFLFFGGSFNKKLDPNTRFIKMHGRKIYEFAVSRVPEAMQICLDQSGIPIDEVKKVIIHQANEKMDEAIIHRFFKRYGRVAPAGVMPMSIHKLGNSSVATVPTLFHMLLHKQIKGQSIAAGDVLLFASVGAGMNINAFVYRV
jgi:3-oxoacyl-[acyl-carrier-protein] synthase-3